MNVYFAKINTQVQGAFPVGLILDLIIKIRLARKQ